MREVFKQLTGILQIAVEPRDEIIPLAPAEVERLIAATTGRDRILVALGGHLGLRPLEARTAPWNAFDGRTLLIGRSRTKRAAARTRVLEVPTVTTRLLREWQLESGGRDDDPIVPMTARQSNYWNVTLQSTAERVVKRSDVTALHAEALTRIAPALRRLHDP